MTEVHLNLPKPEIHGEGHVLYCCEVCKQLMEPDQAVIVDGRSYHLDHVPEITDGR